MKKLFTLLSLALAATACQHPAPTTQAAVDVPLPSATAPPPTATHPVPVWPALPPLFAAADTLTPSMQAVVRANDLAPLWNNSADSDNKNPSFDGFFGPDHYRFGMVFNTVTRDSTNPARYLVQGKCNYRKSKNIRPFTGTLTVRQVLPLRYPGFLRARSVQFDRAADSVAGHLYTARAQLQLLENPATDSGVFEGEVLLDFFVVPGQPAGYVYVFEFEGSDDRLPTRGGLLRLWGNRRNVTTGQVKSFLVAPNVIDIAPSIFKDFVLNERMGEINPKYAKLGWNNYWQNDEWWADSPKPNL